MSRVQMFTDGVLVDESASSRSARLALNNSSLYLDVTNPGPVTTRSGALLDANSNLAGLLSIATARTNLGLGSADNPTFNNLTAAGGTINLGPSSDAKIVRSASGPTVDLCATGGLRSRNYANGADAPISGSTGTLNQLVLSGNISSAAWTTSGLRIKGITATLTDTTSTGTVAAAYTDVLGGNTIAASGTVTFTDYITAFFKDPTAGTGVTFTNKWALGAESLKVGTSNQMTVTNAGAVSIGSTLNVTGNIVGNGDATIGTSGNRQISLSSGNGIVTIKGAATGGYAHQFGFLGNAGTAAGGFGCVGSGDTISSFWIGPSNSSYYASLTASGTTFPSVVIGELGYKYGTNGSTAPYVYPITGGSIGPGSAIASGLGLGFYTYDGAVNGSVSHSFSGNAITSTSGNSNHIFASRQFWPSSGTATWNGLNVNPDINQTGGASGITRGLYVQPQLTAAADFRGVEVGNCGTHYAIKTGTGVVSLGGTLTVTGAITAPSIAPASGSFGISAGSNNALNITGTSSSEASVNIISNTRTWNLCVGSTTPSFSGLTTSTFAIRDGSSGIIRMTMDTSGNVSFIPAATFSVVPSSFTNSSGTSNPVKITATYNQTGTAGSTDLLINRTDTAVGSGSHYFADFQVASVTKWNVSKFGTVTQSGNIVFPGTAVTRTIQVGDTYGDASELQILNGVTTIGKFNAATGFITGLNIQASGIICAGGAIPTTTFGAGVTLGNLGKTNLQGTATANGSIVLQLDSATITGTCYPIKASGNSTSFFDAYFINNGNGGTKLHAIAAAGGGDVQVQYEVNGGTIWSQGLDVSDSSAFILSKSSSLGTSNVFRVDASTLNTVFEGSVTSVFQSLSANPSTIDIPASKTRMVKNTTSGVLSVWANDAGVMKSVPLT